MANALVEQGHDVYVALVPDSPLHQKLAPLPAQNLLTLRMRGAVDVASAIKLARFARKHQIEIVHAHRARDYPLAALAAKLASYPRLILTRHVLFPLGRWHRFTLSNVHRVIAVSNAVAASLRAQQIFPAHKICVIHNGINVQSFDLAVSGFDRDAYRRSLHLAARFLVGCLGEISQVKGHEDFVRAAANLAEQRPDTEFIIAGSDVSPTAVNRARLEHLIAQLNLRERVHLIGHLEDVAPLLSSLDVFVSASHTEAFGLSIVEAMASGVAVVANATDGAREVIDDGETGRLVPIGDAGAMAAAINALLEDEEERKRLGTLARAAARKQWSLNRMVTATESIYQKALDVKRLS
ncbi:MAG: glycosyltransferase family 4 protein [Pyrinomonadaceae bacterium]|nr:glycosyltransferase family 4 protein [Pyrinomonadaceae bacterium]